MSLKLWVGWGGGDTKRRGRGELREEEREGGRGKDGVGEEH